MLFSINVYTVSSNKRSVASCLFDGSVIVFSDVKLQVNGVLSIAVLGFLAHANILRTLDCSFVDI